MRLTSTTAGGQVYTFFRGQEAFYGGLHSNTSQATAHLAYGKAHVQGCAQLWQMHGQRLSESRLQGDPFVSSTQRPVFPTAAALDDMHIVSLATQSDCNSAQHIKAMMDALEQVKFDQLRLKLQQEGLDLSLHSCFPRRHPVTGRPLYVLEDEPHKIKNANQGIQRQVIKSMARPELHSLIATIKAHRMQFPGSLRTPEHCPNLLPKLESLAVAKSQPEFNTLATIIDGATDMQNVACTELAFTAETSFML